MGVCGITTRGNQEQAELIRLIMDNQHSIIFVTGNAGQVLGKDANNQLAWITPKQLYIHAITGYGSKSSGNNYKAYMSMQIICDSNVSFNIASLADYLYSHNFKGIVNDANNNDTKEDVYPCFYMAWYGNDLIQTTNTIYICNGVYANTNTTLQFQGCKLNTFSTPKNTFDLEYLYDTVTPL